MSLDLIFKELDSAKGESAFTCIKNLKDVRRNVQKRIIEPWKIRQRYASLCGPTVFMQTLASRFPEVYAQYVADLILKGEAKIGNLKIKPGNDCKKYNGPSNMIDPVDWVALASLRDATNGMFDYQSPSDEFSGITLPSALEGWFVKTGLFRTVDNRTNLIFDKGLGNFIDAVTKNVSNNMQVCLFIGSRLLNMSPKSSSKGNCPADHWVILSSNSRVLVDGQPITSYKSWINDKSKKEDLEKLYDKKITFTVQTWGEANFPATQTRNNLTVAEFLDFYYGYVCAG
ncbi:hypothetical protein ACKC9G_14505 [Pokkaliibacter sp. CJK22405]|uniref:hypothetical protein n=1 Tax=Pokkaliibacter sp. CJK22405 TaxID=3384615 RepID=UPI00398463C9